MFKVVVVNLVVRVAVLLLAAGVAGGTSRYVVFIIVSSRCGFETLAVTVTFLIAMAAVAVAVAAAAAAVAAGAAAAGAAGAGAAAAATRTLE